MNFLSYFQDTISESPYVLPSYYVKAYRTGFLSTQEISDRVHRSAKSIRDALKRQLGFLHPPGRVRFQSASEEELASYLGRSYRDRSLTPAQIADILAARGWQVTPRMVFQALRKGPPSRQEG
jgi:transposase